MPNTKSGAIYGSLIGLASGILARKLLSPRQSMGWKDYLMWGGAGAGIGAATGAAIGHNINEKKLEEDIGTKILLEEKADIEDRLKSKDSVPGPGWWEGVKAGGSLILPILAVAALKGKGTARLMRNLSKTGPKWSKALSSGVRKLRWAMHPARKGKDMPKWLSSVFNMYTGATAAGAYAAADNVAHMLGVTEESQLADRLRKIDKQLQQRGN